MPVASMSSSALGLLMVGPAAIAARSAGPLVSTMVGVPYSWASRTSCA